ncbi:hypothetical protein CDAR_544551 [Caerostris darwini]|uniref:Uncharacterized protein n=1 Tax=Caerostris darwini TaxID=1538125 RepID=A0AAV4QHT3_9ARAC|nr:hypothetical protein CDAR_544551 [Caerostris darwini]
MELIGRGRVIALSDCVAPLGKKRVEYRLNCKKNGRKRGRFNGKLHQTTPSPPWMGRGRKRVILLGCAIQLPVTSSVSLQEVFLSSIYP